MTTTCFLFARHLQEQACLSLSLDQYGKLADTLLIRSFEEIQLLQKHCSETILVLPCEQVSFHRVELPLLGEKKARIAIPYAIEEQLATNIHELHFAFDRRFHQDQHYLVVVSNRDKLLEQLALFKEHNIEVHRITVDWFALNQQEAMCLEHLLIRSDTLNGYVSDELFPFLPKSLQHEVIPTFCFPDSPASSPSSFEKKRQTEPAALWVAQRLLLNPSINLCQGEIQCNQVKTSATRWYWAATSMTVLWASSFLLLNGVTIYNLNHKVKEIDTQIAASYRQFFPQATQVISPRFRIEQLLKANTGDTSEHFWSLLDALTQAATEIESLKVEQLRFQNQVLSVNLISPDFGKLETLENELQKKHVKVKQLEASTQDEGVLAILELSA